MSAEVVQEMCQLNLQESEENGDQPHTDTVTESDQLHTQYRRYLSKLNFWIHSQLVSVQEK